MFIYVAHPYGRSIDLSEEAIQSNVAKSIDLGRQLIQRGHNPFIPNLLHFVHKDWADTPDEPVWFALVSAWIRKCDALYFGGSSTGTNAERRIAFGLRLPIYYSMDQVPGNAEAELLEDTEVLKEYIALEPKYVKIQRGLSVMANRPIIE